jgi:hypothetical protein
VDEVQKTETRIQEACQKRLGKALANARKAGKEQEHRLRE